MLIPVSVGIVLGLLGAGQVELESYGLTYWLMIGFFYVWIFTLGSAIGSFLNVVVYRMPLGIGLVWPGSRCPVCMTAIRLTDNLPVWGWFLLGGRCRACRLPISGRYPFVEFAVGLIFLLVAYVEIGHGGGNLPDGNTRAVFPGLMFTLLHFQSRLIGIMIYHLIAITGLVCFALLEHDRQSVPGRLWRTFLIIALIFPVGWTLSVRAIDPSMPTGFLRDSMHPQPAVHGWARMDNDGFWGVGDATVGLLAGAGLSLLLTLRRPMPRSPVIAAGSVVGAYFGWQLAVGVLSASACVLLLQSLAQRRWLSLPAIPIAAIMLVMTVMHVWQWAAIAPHWSSVTLSSIFLLTAGLFIDACSALVAHGRQHSAVALFHQ